MNMGLTLRDLKFNVHAHPTVAEVGTAGGDRLSSASASVACHRQSVGTAAQWWCRAPPGLTLLCSHPLPPPSPQVNEELIRHAQLENTAAVKPAAAGSKQPVAA